MNRFNIITLLFTALCFCAISSAQSAKNYDVKSGLSSNSVKSILQDGRGYIWIATSDGINLFNGHNFMTYGHSYASQQTDTKDKTVLNLMAIVLHEDGKKIWAGAQSGNIYLFNPDDETFTTLALTADNSTHSPNICYCLTYDSMGRLWAGTDQGLYVYDETRDEMKHYSSDNVSLPDNIISSILCDSNGTIWIGTSKGLVKYNYAADDFNPIKVDSDSFGRSEIHITSITEGNSDILWIGTWDKGLAVLGKKSNTLRQIQPQGDAEHALSMRVRSTLIDEKGLLWLCTNIGLFKLDITNNHLSSVILSAVNPNDNIYSIFMDQEHGIWVGSMFQGLYYLAPRARQIGCYTQENVRELLNGSAISSFLEDERGLIYIGAENGGLSLFDPIKGKFLKHHHNIQELNIHALCKDNNTLFIGTYGQGLRSIDLNTGKVEAITRRHIRQMPSDNIFSLYKGSDGYIYIGTDDGCAAYDSNSSRMEEIHELEDLFIYCITEDKNGDLWFASYYSGIYRLDRKSGNWKHYVHDSADPRSLPDNKATGIYQDDSKKLWICTAGGGICSYNYETDDFDAFTLKENDKNLPLSKISGIQSDSKGTLWISSSRGIYVCNPDGEIIRHLTHEDGLQSNQFCINSIYKSSTGSIYFGGVSGFNIINPEDIHEVSIPPTVTVSIVYGNDTEMVKTPVTNDFADISIPRHISSFSMDFECLSYMAPGKNRFAYRIDDSEWTHTSSPSANFINFPYGKHVITVKGCNGDGLWSNNAVSVKINNLPPTHKSFIAKIIYISLIIAIIIIVLVLIERRNSEKNTIELNRIRAEQKQEAYQAKIDFFTHVAHEIKTPVTLIKAPLDAFLQHNTDNKDFANLEIMSRNTDRLLNLVNQLLDFKKISSDGHDICMKASDPVSLIEDVINRFDIAILGDIAISSKMPDRQISCMMDPEAYTKIISNLITNGVKHAKSQITVCLDISQNNEYLHLEVSDDGPGIPIKDSKRIFDSFYQINTLENPRIGGVGLGLSLVKLLVQKHNGKAYVDNDYTDGCRICIDIPYIATEIKKEKEITLNSGLKFDINEGDITQNRILIVEDTVDMLDFISGIFIDKHQIYKAGNGKIALEILSKHDIDIIISDVSMPVMNGFEFLQEIRRNEMYCHIPVIMLTVESALESRIKGLEYGADAYIAKPFSTTHLIASVNNLISRRDTMRKQYAASPLSHTRETVISSRDQKWVDHLYNFINNNIQESEITIDMLATEFNISRSSFQRKLKGLTGLSPIEQVRLIRLKKAAELLETGEYRINEVAYMVGFNKPSYFSSLFKKQFGVLPKDYKQNTTQ